MDNQDLKIEEGTINFWIEESKIIFNDNKTTPLISVNPEGGSIFLLKDDDNKLKAFYVVLNRGRVDLEYDVSGMDSSKKHMVTLTWNLNSKIFNLFIDGKEMVTKEIIF